MSTLVHLTLLNRFNLLRGFLGLHNGVIYEAFKLLFILKSLRAEFHHKRCFEAQVSPRHQHVILHRTLEYCLRIRHSSILIRHLIFNGTPLWVGHDNRRDIRFLVTIRVSRTAMMSHYPFLHLWSENQVRSVCLRTISMGESTAHVLLEEGFG